VEVTSHTVTQHPEDNLEKAPIASRRSAKLIWSAAGTFFLGLGIVGIAVPLLPTTPFLLLAAACYLRGSARMYRWMLANKYFGQYLRDYRTGKGLTLKVKIGTVSLLWAAIVFSAMLTTSNPIVRIALFVVAVGVTLHIVTLKTKKDPESVRQ